MKNFLVPPVFILFLIAVLVYQNTLSNGFTYDDSAVIVENYYIKDLAWFRALLDNRYFEFFGEESYRPLVSFTYFLDYSLWGLSSRGFHGTNLLLHAINTSLFFIFFTRLFRGEKWIFFASLLFAIHPVMTESVNAIGFREELLTVLFCFAGLLLFLKACQVSRRAPSVLSLLFSLLFFTAGLFSKENMLIYPLLVILVWGLVRDLNLKKPYGWNLFVVGLMLVVGAYIIVRFGVFSGKKEVEIFSNDLGVRMATGISIIGYYLKLFLFPFPLAPEYTFPRSTGIEWIRAVVTFLGLFWIGRLVWAHKVLRFGWLWFLMALLPTLNIYPISNPMAERYLYFPATGVYVMVAALIGGFSPSGLFDGWQIKIETGLKLLILICFAALTYDRNADWQSMDSLWEKAYKVTPESYKVLNSLGIIYNGRGNPGAAIQVLKRSLEKNPNSVRTYSNLGLAYYEAGQTKLAVETLGQGLKMDPENIYLLINMAKVKIETNEIEEGLRLVEKAIKNRPYYAEPFLIKGNLYMSQGNFEKAFAAYRAAAHNRPDYPEPLINLGVLYGRRGQFKKAVEVLNRALVIDPADPVANINRASAYYFLKDYGNAAIYAKIANESGAVLPDILLPLVTP